MFCKKICAILILILLVSSVSAFKNDPEDFRGIKWGTTIDSLDDMKKISIEDDLHNYSRLNDKMTIGDAKLDIINYIFWDNKFLAVSISGNGFSNFINLKNAVFKSFGAGFQFNEYIEEYKWGIGKFDKTLIILDYNEISEKFHLFLYNKQYWLEREEFKQEKAKDAINDF